MNMISFFAFVCANNIHVNINNDSQAFPGEWVVSVNTLDGKGAKIFHNKYITTAIIEAGEFLQIKD